MIFIYILFSLIFIIFLLLAVLLIKLKTGNKKVLKELSISHFNKFSDIGSIKKLSLLPLVDFYTDDNRLKTEPGVSYLIKADEINILMDMGLNMKKEHPSPLFHNIKTLGVSPDSIDFIFISHLHLDHLGGMREQKNGLFSISHGEVKLPEIPVYSPAEISPSKWNQGPYTEIIREPVKIKNGIASIGVIPRNLFIMGYTQEHSLAVNVKNRGIVLIIGCGHQTIERILERTRRLFDEPIFGIIGGLHYPVKGGRMMLGPFNVQKIGTDRPPWIGITEEDVKHAIDTINEYDPQFVSLSPHDSSDWSIEQFREAFKEKYYDLKVGKELRI